MKRRPASRVPLPAVAVLLCGLFATDLAAQSQATSGIIRGTVTSQGGAPVAGAQVELRNTRTNITRTTSTNERGIYVAALLPVGTYDVVARQPGATEARRTGVSVRLGETVQLDLELGTVQLAAIEVAGAGQVDATRVEAATRLTPEVVSNTPNNGRNFLSLTLLTPGVAIVQGPDGDELSVGGQRGIYNNMSVDGADFNNPFFGEQRGGQRPAFTFNLDAVEEMVVVAQGANAEFGRSAGGFVNVLTRSGTNTLRGSLHAYTQNDALSASQFRNQGSPDFSQLQFGFTLGGPLRRDRAFFFVAYDQQTFNQTKQTDPNRIAAPLRAWMDTAFGGALAGDYGAIRRTNDANALLVKLDFRLSPVHSASLKYNYTNSRQENGTFDVDTWGRSANGLERDYSHAVNGSLVSLVSPTLTNEFRFQYAREDRPRPYEGPTFPGTDGSTFRTNGRPFPDTGADFAFGYRWGMPFFLPIEAYDTRFQILNNLTLLRGNHLFKVGAEYNRTFIEQTFIGFANERFIFGSVDGFLGYAQDPTYVECFDGAGAFTGSGRTSQGFACPAGSSVGGPLLLYLQLAPVQAGQTAREVGNQSFAQHEIAAFIQDSWKPRPNLTLNLGLRWEAQVQPDPITDPSQVFYQPFIGQTTSGYRFPSDGRIPSDYGMWQPRVGFAYDMRGDGSQVLRGNVGLYYARTPGLVFASSRTSNGSVGQTLFCNSSFFINCGATPPAYDNVLPAPAGGTPFFPGVTVTDENFKNPRTLAMNLGFERRLSTTLAASASYAFARTTRLNRFVNRNDAVFGTPFGAFPGNPGNGIGVLTVLESTARSQYHGFTLTLGGQPSDALQFQANYTLSFDKSDDDNERDPFSFRYAQADSLEKEYNWSDRDQRHRANVWFLARVMGFHLNNRLSYYSAQPTSEVCGAGNAGTGEVATTPQQRICANGSILRRNTLRKDNAFFSWDVRVSRPFAVGRGTLEAIVEVFNLTNTFNLKNPSAPGLLFNFDGTIRSGLGDPRRVQAGLRWVF